jgi:hypothetical protein
LLDVGLVELFKGEYALTTMMSTKKDIFDKWTKCYMCGDYYLVNKWTHLNKYTMLLPKEFFDALRQTKVFSTLGLWFGYQ